MEVCISLGSNLASAWGDPAATVSRAIEDLHSLSMSYCRASSLYETTPVDCPPDSPLFINAVVKMDVADNTQARDFLNSLQSIESKYGRFRGPEMHAARSLDLDLITFGELQQQDSGMEIPHPRAHERRFVLTPLVEIDPDFIIPGFTDTVAELLRRLPEDPGLRAL